MSDEKEAPSVRDHIKAVKRDIQKELRSHDGEVQTNVRTDTTIASDAPVYYSGSDVSEVGDNHFRVNLGRGFGLDLVLLDSSSLAFKSFDHTLLDLKSDKGWPGSLFMPVVGQA